jgi:Tfp pilus assembly protein PilN
LTSREIPVGLAQMKQDGYAEILKQWEMTQMNTGSEKLTGPLDPVYLASTANLPVELGTEFAKMQDNLAVKELHLTQSLPLFRGVRWPGLMTDEGVSVAALAGIAFSPELVPIDLIPRVVRKIQEQHAYQRQLVIAGAWVAAALVSLGLSLGIGFFWKNVQLAHVEKELRDIKHDTSVVDSQLQKVYDIEGMIKNRLVFSDLARDIYSLLPAQVYLVSISISEGNTLSLQGVSSNSVEINQFQKDMVNSQNFIHVNLDYVNKRVTAQGEVDYFKITSTFKPANGQK